MLPKTQRAWAKYPDGSHITATDLVVYTDPSGHRRFPVDAIVVGFTPQRVQVCFHHERGRNPVPSHAVAPQCLTRMGDPR